jgi:hypothetical protein
LVRSIRRFLLCQYLFSESFTQNSEWKLPIETSSWPVLPLVSDLKHNHLMCY